MLGVGLEPCSIARFTMIEETEEDDYFDEDDEDEEEDHDDEGLDESVMGIEKRKLDFNIDDLPPLDDGIGSFE